MAIVTQIVNKENISRTKYRITFTQSEYTIQELIQELYHLPPNTLIQNCGLDDNKFIVIDLLYMEPLRINSTT